MKLLNDGDWTLKVTHGQSNQVVDMLPGVAITVDSPEPGERPVNIQIVNEEPETPEEAAA